MLGFPRGDPCGDPCGEKSTIAASTPSADVPDIRPTTRRGDLGAILDLDLGILIVAIQRLADSLFCFGSPFHATETPGRMRFMAAAIRLTSGMSDASMTRTIGAVGAVFFPGPAAARTSQRCHFPLVGQRIEETCSD